CRDGIGLLDCHPRLQARDAAKRAKGARTGGKVIASEWQEHVMRLRQDLDAEGPRHDADDGARDFVEDEGLTDDFRPAPEPLPEAISENRHAILSGLALFQRKPAAEHWLNAKRRERRPRELEAFDALGRIQRRRRPGEWNDQRHRFEHLSFFAEILTVEIRDLDRLASVGWN